MFGLTCEKSSTHSKFFWQRCKIHFKSFHLLSIKTRKLAKERKKGRRVIIVFYFYVDLHVFFSYFPITILFHFHSFHLIFFHSSCSCNSTYSSLYDTKMICHFQMKMKKKCSCLSRFHFFYFFVNE